MWNEKPEIKKPFYANQRKVFVDTLERFVSPLPAIPLKDWPHWNERVGGFRSKEFSILCGSTGAGKTTFLANISAQLLKQKVKHYVMSVETGHEDYMARVISALVGRDLNTGDMVPPDLLSRLIAPFGEVLEADTIEFSLYEDRVSVEQLMADVRYMVETYGVKVAMIDNINFFMEVTNAANQVVEMDRVIHELIIFCKKVDVHLVMVMHPKKTSDGSTRVTSEFDIKGSSTAVQEAHNVFLFNRPREEAIQNGILNKNDRELTIRKMRRRGKFVGETIVFSSQDTKYIEKGKK